MSNLDSINKLKSEQKEYIKKLQKIAKLPEAKKAITAINRAAKCVMYSIAIYKIQGKINILTTHPTPNLEKGCVFPECGEEIITDKAGNDYFVEKPTILKQFSKT